MKIFGQVVKCEFNLEGESKCALSYGGEFNKESLFSEVKDEMSGNIYIVANLDGYKITKVI